MTRPYISNAPLTKPLNLRQQRFVQEYLVDGIAAAAARRAGYSVKSSLHSGHQLMKNPRVLGAIAAAKAARDAPWTREMAVEALRKIASANVLDYARPGADGALDLWRLERDRAGAVKGLSVVERTDPASGAVTRTVGFTLADRSAALIRLLPMLEPDGATAAAALARGRDEGARAVAALSAEGLGRLRAFLEAPGRGRGAREGALDAFLAGEASAAVAAAAAVAAVAAEQALAAREEDLDELAATLDAEWEALSEARHRLDEERRRLAGRQGEAGPA